MDLLDIRRVFNMRVNIFGMDKSDISFAMRLWIVFYLLSILFSSTIYESDQLLMVSIASIVPLVFIVKIIKIGKNIGHLEYLSIKLGKLKECKKNGNYSPYNLNTNNFIYKTKLFIRKPTE